MLEDIFRERLNVLRLSYFSRNYAAFPAHLAVLDVLSTPKQKERLDAVLNNLVCTGPHEHLWIYMFTTPVQNGDIVSLDALREWEDRGRLFSCLGCGQSGRADAGAYPHEWDAPAAVLQEARIWNARWRMN